MSNFEQTPLNRGDQNASLAWEKGNAMLKDLVELARICVKQSRASPRPEVAAELMRMAKEYQCRAAETKVSSQIDDSELDEFFRLLNLFATPSPKCIEAMRSVESAA
ncbi:MAG TPA: hypothetical protein VEM32_09615 [Geobacteraceae bacterium]|nr:hypothetical protein [Geobacteraceae bacterium]